MDPLSLSGLFRLLSIEFDSIVKLQGNLNIDSLAKFDFNFNFPIYMMPNGVQVDGPDGKPIGDMSSALLLPQEDAAPGSPGMSHAIALPRSATDPEPRQPQLPLALPFSQGLHYVINQRSWWQEGSQITLGDTVSITKLIPASIDTPICIAPPERAPSSQSFWVEVRGNGTVGFALSPRPVGPLPEVDLQKPPVQGGEIWRFTHYTPQSIMRLSDTSSTILSFDPAVVREAWLIDYERARRSPNIRYVLVCATESSFRRPV